MPSRGSRKVILKLSREAQQSLAALARDVVKGPLVDLDPEGSQGADFPNVAYRVNKNGRAILIAERRGDAHTYAILEGSALEVKRLLESLHELSSLVQN